jgi:hypothetical protein
VTRILFSLALLVSAVSLSSTAQARPGSSISASFLANGANAVFAILPKRRQRSDDRMRGLVGSYHSTYRRFSAPYAMCELDD